MRFLKKHILSELILTYPGIATNQPLCLLRLSINARKDE
jgi:hypothetical protein